MRISFKKREKRTYSAVCEHHVYVCVWFHETTVSYSLFRQMYVADYREEMLTIQCYLHFKTGGLSWLNYCKVLSRIVNWNNHDCCNYSSSENYAPRHAPSALKVLIWCRIKLLKYFFFFFGKSFSGSLHTQILLDFIVQITILAPKWCSPMDPSLLPPRALIFFTKERCF